MLYVWLPRLVSPPWTLYVAAALAVGADELITSEKPGKPVHRVQGITVRTIHAPQS
jgi:hypothetical protein